MLARHWPVFCGRNFPLVVPTITRDSDTLRCPMVACFHRAPSTNA